jgi:hypothetical protein
MQTDRFIRLGRIGLSGPTIYSTFAICRYIVGGERVRTVILFDVLLWAEIPFMLLPFLDSSLFLTE